MNAPELITYGITFLAVYVQVFLLITFFERRKELRAAHREGTPLLTETPRVAIIVPCWNEEKTLHGTIASLLALDYPSEQLEIIAVDDGSTDGTWRELQTYAGNPQVKVFRKENGGKHTAVNFGIDQTDASFVGCLDADSYVAPDALRRMINVFQKKKDVYAVTPSLIIHQPKNILQHAQWVEYNMSTYNKKMLSFLGAIHVTPGPFSVFRREVFERIGKFKKAHNTEDQEIAYRMQANHLKIEHCHTARVFTSSPDTVKKLYKQRLRWIYGFIQNTIDYRYLIFKNGYGNFSFFTLPSGVISIVAVVYISAALLYNFFVYIAQKITEYSITGLHIGTGFHFHWFFINTQAIVFVTIALYAMILTSIIIGTRLNQQGRGFHWYIIPYLLIYTLIAPFWLLKAVWNSIFLRRQPSWR